jgi:hypothetical protein
MRTSMNGKTGDVRKIVDACARRHRLGISNIKFEGDSRYI